MTALAGFFIAVIIGLTGVGGGVLTAPVLLLFLGMSAPQAVGTALVFVAVVKLFAAPMFILRCDVNYRVLALLLVGGVPGAVVGSLIMTHMSSRGLEGLMLILLGLTIIPSAAATFLRRRNGLAGANKVWRLPFVSFPIGVEVGFSSAGAGALGSLALMHWTTLRASEIVGTDLLFGLALSLSGGAMHLSQGSVDGSVLRSLLVGGIPGVIFGACLTRIVPGRALRTALSVWLIWLGASLFYRGFASLAF
ncbi:MAG: sulfite exporter TauE/SafE family protein [Acidobacteria bacterium]|nr:sulfite exporter TauE/SafE family protein [Acidobacteriota bacterium]